jgi:CheY-like chemotaxis protein
MTLDSTDELTGAYILVVDDDDDVRESLIAAFESFGFEAVGAENGRVALELLQIAMPPAVILLDYMMPEMNVPDFAEAVGKDPALSGIPIILSTGSGQQPTISGLAARLAKPHSIERLIETVEGVSGLRRCENDPVSCQGGRYARHDGT